MNQLTCNTSLVAKFKTRICNDHIYCSCDQLASTRRGNFGADFEFLETNFKKGNSDTFNPFTPTSDQDRISPNNINTISSRQVMRIEKNINYGIIS